MGATTTWPASVIPSGSQIIPVPRGKSFESPLSGFIQTASRDGAKWVLRLTFNEIDTDIRGELIGLVTWLNGQVNRVEVGDQSYSGARGALGGLPVVDGAGQTGGVIRFRGCSLSTVGWMKRGDFFSFTGGDGRKELKMCTLDADTDAGGEVDIHCFPEIHSTPADGSPIEVINPVGTFMLAPGFGGWSNAPATNNAGEPIPTSNLSLDLVEDIGGNHS